MKKIYLINMLAFCIILILYITNNGGLIAQVFLGILQVVLALVITFNSTIFKKYKKRIGLYWTIVIPYLFSLLFIENSIGEIQRKIGFSYNYSYLVYLIIIPMCIASYFVYITYSIYKNAPNEL